MTDITYNPPEQPEELKRYWAFKLNELENAKLTQFRAEVGLQSSLQKCLTIEILGANGRL